MAFNFPSTPTNGQAYTAHGVTFEFDGQAWKMPGAGGGGSIPAYALTNVTTDRIMDADLVTIDEMADVLGTLITDIAAGGVGGGGGSGGSTQALAETRAAAISSTIDVGVKTLRTAGYALPGDGGHGLYKRVNALPAHAGQFRSLDRFKADGTTDSTNGGYWELVAESGRIDVRQLGAKCDGITDDLAAWNAARAYWRANADSYIPELTPWGGGTVCFSGESYVSDTIEIKIVVFSIVGAGSGRGFGEHSFLRFPANKTGIIVQSFNTTGEVDEDYIDNPGRGHGSGARLENFGIISNATGNPAGTGTGIVLRGRAALRNLSIRGFSQDGVRVQATAGGELEGNANGWFAENLDIQWCGRHGFATTGADANAGTGIAIDVSHCGGFAFYLNDFLGNTYIGCQSATCGGLGPAETPNTVTSMVSHGGNRYSVIVGKETQASTTTPGTDETVWAYNGSGGPMSMIPAWVSGTTYRSGGSYYCTQASARNVLVSCYSESDHGCAQVSPPSMFLGGLLAAGSASINETSMLSGRQASGGFIASESMGVAGYRGAGGPAGDLYELILGGNSDETSTDLLTYKDPDYFSGGWRIKRYTNNLIFDFNNTQTHLIITGPNSTNWSFGRSAPVTNAIMTDNLWLGPYGDDCRQITFRSTAPTSGAWAKGDVVFNNNASAGGFAGWYCVTAGTPGTWKTFGAISA